MTARSILAGVAPADGSVDVPLVLAPYEARLIVIGTCRPAPRCPCRANSKRDAARFGWQLVVTMAEANDTPLNPGRPRQQFFKGIAEYRKSFDLTGTPPQGGACILTRQRRRNRPCQFERHRLRLPRLDAVVWDVTDSIKPSDNMLVIQVQSRRQAVAASGRRPAARRIRRGAGRAGGSGGQVAQVAPACRPKPRFLAAVEVRLNRRPHGLLDGVLISAQNRRAIGHGKFAGAASSVAVRRQPSPSR